MRRSRKIRSSYPRRCDSGIMPTRWSFAIFKLSTRSFFFFDFVIHESSFGCATVISEYPMLLRELDTEYADPDASKAILVSSGILLLNSPYPSGVLGNLNCSLTTPSGGHISRYTFLVSQIYSSYETVHAIYTLFTFIHFVLQGGSYD